MRWGLVSVLWVRVGRKNPLLTGKSSNRTRLTESSDLLEPAGGKGKEDKRIPKNLIRQFNQRHLINIDILKKLKKR